MTSDDVYEEIFEIKGLSGNSKQSYLKILDPEICRYLKAAYNPFVKFGVTSKACLSGKGQNQFNDYTWKVLNALAKRKLTGAAAIQTVKSHTLKLTPRSSAVFGMILDKDFKMGMGAKSINKVYPGLIPTHDVMLAKLFDESRVKFPCFGSPKIDGVRAIFRNGKFFSRNGHEYVGLDRLVYQLSEFSSEILDGELTVIGKSFQEGSGLIRNLNETPNAQFHIFDIPSYKASFEKRLIGIKDISYSTNPNILDVHHQLCNNNDELMNLYQNCRDIGYEGAVVKPLDYQYKGTRSYDWMKMKPVETIDLKVMDLFEGKGKYEGQMGGAIVMFEGKPNRVGGGWSDKARKYFWDNMDEICGKTIEVDYMEKTDDGNMRHARFIRFRPDKD